MTAYDEWLETPYYEKDGKEECSYPCDERDPDEIAEEREERKRISMEMDGPHEEAP